MIETSIANSADYADALLAARKAKNILVLLVLVTLALEHWLNVTPLPLALPVPLAFLTNVLVALKPC